MRFTDLTTFAAERRTILEEGDARLGPRVSTALVRYRRTPGSEWYSGILRGVEDLWDEVYLSEHDEEDGIPEEARTLRTTFLDQVRESLGLTTEPAPTIADRRIQEQRITRWLSTATVNDATVAAVATTPTDEAPLLEWVTMGDDDVRESHRAANGQQRPIGETFDIDGEDLPYPGAPVGPPEVWINCRCVLRPTLGGDEMSTTTTQTFAVAENDDIDDVIDDEIDPDAPTAEDAGEDTVPFHGVLAPVGVMSGDRRRFTEGAVGVRETPGPIPLRWVKSDSGAHQGAVRVGVFDRIWEEDGLIKHEGHFVTNEEAQEAISLAADGAMGVSVDLTDMVAGLVNEDGTEFDFEMWQQGDPEPVLDVTEAKIGGATIVDIPAFAEAYVALGPWEDEESLAASGCIACEEMDRAYNEMLDFAISDAEWDGDASRFNDEQWQRSTIVDRGEEFDTAKERYAVPIKEPNGDLNRNAVHNAAARIDQVDAPEDAVEAGKRALVAAYRQLDEEPPEAIVASALAIFAPGTKDGPGWLTNPRDTQRLRDYWTRGEGAAKIRWGQPGDFNRCRQQLAKYVKNPKYLAGTCANLHKVALGIWPGQEKAQAKEGAVMASAFTIETEVQDALTAAAVRPANWFSDPGLTGPTAVTITDDGHIYGHVATFDVCHIANPEGQDICTTAPRSVTDYAYFKTGLVRTDDGDVAVGHITMGTGHAGGRLNANKAAAHYDNTGAVVADVTVGEDQFGIWFSGAVRPNLDDEVLDALRAAALSGDWRKIRGNLEMVAALAVNVPGFPIPRASLAASADQGQYSLTASGIVWAHEGEKVPFEPMDPSVFASAVLAEMKRQQRTESIRAKFAAERTKRTAAIRESLGR